MRRPPKPKIAGSSPVGGVALGSLVSKLLKKIYLLTTFKNLIKGKWNEEAIPVGGVALGSLFFFKLP